MRNLFGITQDTAQDERLKVSVDDNIMMPYQLILSEQYTKGQTKEVGENVFLNNLPSDSEVYLLYYFGASRDKEFENKLRAWGESTGKNLYVNIGGQNDPSFKKIVNKLDVENLPFIIVTANSRLASHPIEFETAYVKLDSKKLLMNHDLTIDCVQRLFLLFMQEKISEALKQSVIYDRKATVARLNSIVSGVLKGIEFSIELFGVKFGVKPQGE